MIKPSIYEALGNQLIETTSIVIENVSTIELSITDTQVNFTYDIGEINGNLYKYNDSTGNIQLSGDTIVNIVWTRFYDADRTYINR